MNSAETLRLIESSATELLGDGLKATSEVRKTRAAHYVEIGIPKQAIDDYLARMFPRENDVKGDYVLFTRMMERRFKIDFDDNETRVTGYSDRNGRYVLEVHPGGYSTRNMRFLGR